MTNSIFMVLFFLLACSAMVQAQICPCEEESNEKIFFKKLTDTDTKSPEFASFPASVREGIEFLKKTDLNKLPLGRTNIDGDRIFLNKMTYETRSADKVVLESHRKYIDIQYIIQGKEQMACVSLKADLPIKEAYDAEKDLIFYPAEIMPFWKTNEKTPNRVLATDGWFAIFTPNDIHASGIYPDKPGKLYKIVVKCRVD